jgi:hypothetical protein
MTTSSTASRSVHGLAALGLALVVAAAAAPGRAAVRLLVPDEDPGVPAYARIERAYVHHTEEWAAIAFYRSPGCVRSTFNLLNFFDVPAVFGCPLTVHGFEVWENGGPPEDAAPLQAKLRGNGAVPVWFVPWPALEAALADGKLKMPELLALEPLMGTASYFVETLPPDGGANQSVLEIVAHGTLPDGRSFHYSAIEAAGELRVVQIDIR